LSYFPTASAEIISAEAVVAVEDAFLPLHDHVGQVLVHTELLASDVQFVVHAGSVALAAVRLAPDDVGTTPHAGQFELVLRKGVPDHGVTKATPGQGPDAPEA
jgi:hypothetical protein